MKLFNKFEVQINENKNEVWREKRKKKLKLNPDILKSDFDENTSKMDSLFKNKKIRKSTKALKSEKNNYHSKTGIFKIKTSKNNMQLDEIERNVDTKSSSDIKDQIKQSNVEKTPQTLIHTTKLKNVSENSILSKKKKLKKRFHSQSKKQLCTPKHDMGEKFTKEKNASNLNDGSYRPGMVSDMIQIKKYGRLIIPWDHSFGLDPVYTKKYLSKESIKEENGSPKLEVNPLFDLSRQSYEKKPSINKLENAVFVGNLPDETKIIKVKKLFRKFGLIVHAKLRCKEFKSNKSLRDGDCVKSKHEGIKNVNALIRFNNYDSCEAALKMNGELYKGHHLRVTLAKEEGKSDPAKSVFIGNIAFKAQDEDLWKAFEDCGAIESVRVVRDIRSGKGKGYGYVNFKSADSIEQALKLDGTLVLHRNIRVNRNKSDVWSLSNNVTVKRRKMKRKLPGIAQSDKPIKVKQESKTGQVWNENDPEKPVKVTQKSCKNLDKLTEHFTHKKVKKEKKNVNTDQTTE